MYNFLVCNFAIIAENNQNPAAKFLFKGFETVFEPLGKRIICKIRICGNRFYLNANGMTFYANHIVDIPCVIKLGRSFFKNQ